MKWGVVTFPGSNDDHDTLHVVEHVLREEAISLWHKDRDLRGVDIVILPGGFSYGDYLRAGALARFSPVMRSVTEFASAGGLVLGICNGFQILCEAGLLPGALIRNRSLSFQCEIATIRVENAETALTHLCEPGERLRIPIKNGEGCYFADAATLEGLERERRVLFRYEENPNGSIADVAGIVNREGNVFGMMPHPEHATEALLGREDGLRLFRSLQAARSRAERRRA